MAREFIVWILIVSAVVVVLSILGITISFLTILIKRNKRSRMNAALLARGPTGPTGLRGSKKKEKKIQVSDFFYMICFQSASPEGAVPMDMNSAEDVSTAVELDPSMVSVPWGST